MSELNAAIVSLPFSNALTEFAADHVLYQHAEQAVCWQYFCARVNHWDAVCSTIETSKVAVFHADGGEFLALLTAAWRAGKTAIIPPNVLPATLQRLQQETSVLLGEFGNQCYQAPLGKQQTLTTAKAATDENHQALLLYTSGSTGEPTLIGKTFKQLNAEIGLLERRWEQLLDNSLTVATVSHHHMYGLTFKLLWPLLTGKPFHASDVAYLESLPELSRRQQLVLISSPAHLANIPPSVDWPAVRGRIKAVFTAGAALPAAAASQSAANFYCQPTEIFGSTETGIVAWRQQQLDVIWQAFDQIECECSADGQLQLRSPALPDSNWFVSADKIKLKGDGRFALHGRADKVAKVAGKRVSLTEVERLLATHPWVDDVKVLPHVHRPSRLCAVVALNVEGNAQLVDQGVRFTGKSLCANLAGVVERVAYPRYWRFVATMPINQQGKTTAQELTALFDNEQLVTGPTILSSDFNVELKEYHAELMAPHNLCYLQGHFPGQPILPGVVQIAWVVETGRKLFAALGEFEKMEAVKFQQVIQPGERFKLKLRLDSAKNTLLFYYTISDRSVSSGRIAFRPASDAAM